MKTPKQKAWDQMSRYIRLRDSLDYCKMMRIDTSQFNSEKDLPVKCCTCGAVKSWKYMDAGHFISRGSHGASGVYFDERNVHAQCKSCNAFHQGRAEEYRKFMLNKYNPRVIYELERKNILQCDTHYEALMVFYKGAYDGLCMQI